MKRTIATPALVVGVLVVAGCSSGHSADATSPASTTSAAESAGPAPAELDDQTKAWFEALRNGAAPIAELASAADTTGLSEAATQQKGIELLTAISTAFTQTGAALAGTPPPTFDGGEEFASTMTSGLTESGTKVADVAVSLGAVDPSDSAALQQAVGQLQSQLTTALTPLAALDDLDPAISAAAQEIPACGALARSE